MALVEERRYLVVRLHPRGRRLRRGFYIGHPAVQALVCLAQNKGLQGGVYMEGRKGRVLVSMNATNFRNINNPNARRAATRADERGRTVQCTSYTA